MLISRITGGFANQIYNYMAGYALSRKYNKELSLDISETASQFRGYLLDCLNIPDYVKYNYEYKPGNIGDILYIHEDLCKDYVIVIQSVYARNTGIDEIDDKYNVVITDDTDEVEKIVKENDNVYLYGSWSATPLWGDAAIWSELVAQITPRQQCKGIDFFSQRKKEVPLVAVHIRRGDYLMAEGVNIPQGNYYRMSIQWFRDKLNNPEFYIFTDDHEWAYKELGDSEDIHHFSAIGGLDGDIEEFFCLSSCDYKILSNHSGFSSLADQLNGGDNNITISFADNFSQQVSFIGGLISDAKGIAKKILKSSSKGEPWNGHTSPYISYAKRIHLIEEYDMNYNYFPNEEYSDQELYEKIMGNAELPLEGFADYSREYRPISHDKMSALLRKKMIALVEEKQYESAWLIMHKIRFEHNDKEFLQKVIECCFELKKYELLAVEIEQYKRIYVDDDFLCSMRERLDGLDKSNVFKRYEMSSEGGRKNYIVIPGKNYSDPSVRLYGIEVIGVLLHQLGNNVSFIFADNKYYSKYIDKYEYLTDADNTTYGCKQYGMDVKAEDIYDRKCKNIVLYEDEDMLEEIHGINDSAKYECVKYIDLLDYAVETVAARMGYADIFEYNKKYYDALDVLLT